MDGSKMYTLDTEFRKSGLVPYLGLMKPHRGRHLNYRRPVLHYSIVAVRGLRIGCPAFQLHWQ